MTIEKTKFLKVIEKKEDFECGKCYVLLSKDTFRQVDSFICTTPASGEKKLSFYEGRCLIVENMTDKEIEKAIKEIKNENSVCYWQFVRAAHSKSGAYLSQCIAQQKEMDVLEKWLLSRKKISA